MQSSSQSQDISTIPPKVPAARGRLRRARRALNQSSGAWWAPCFVVLFICASAGPGIAAVSATPSVGAPLTAEQDRWVSPVGDPMNPPVLRTFDPPAQRWEAGHRGVDLAASEGQSVRSAGAGVVSFAGVIAGRPVMTVRHGELRTTYEPVAAGLSTGSVVDAGQLIGTIATGGHCSSRCLHWGLLRADTYLDPLALLLWQPPVLKPPPGNRAPSVRSTEGRAGTARTAPNSPTADPEVSNNETAGVVTGSSPVGFFAAGLAGVAAAIGGFIVARRR